MVEKIDKDQGIFAFAQEECKLQKGAYQKMQAWSPNLPLLQHHWQENLSRSDRNMELCCSWKGDSVLRGSSHVSKGDIMALVTL